MKNSKRGSKKKNPGPKRGGVAKSNKTAGRRPARRHQFDLPVHRSPVKFRSAPNRLNVPPLLPPQAGTQTTKTTKARSSGKKRPLGAKMNPSNIGSSTAYIPGPDDPANVAALLLGMDDSRSHDSHLADTVENTALGLSRFEKRQRIHPNSVRSIFKAVVSEPAMAEFFAAHADGPKAPWTPLDDPLLPPVQTTTTTTNANNVPTTSTTTTTTTTTTTNAAHAKVSRTAPKPVAVKTEWNPIDLTPAGGLAQNILRGNKLPAKKKKTAPKRNSAGPSKKKGTRRRAASRTGSATGSDREDSDYAPEKVDDDDHPAANEDWVLEPDELEDLLSELKDVQGITSPAATTPGTHLSEFDEDNNVYQTFLSSFNNDPYAQSILTKWDDDADYKPTTEWASMGDAAWAQSLKDEYRADTSTRVPIFEANLLALDAADATGITLPDVAGENAQIGKHITVASVAGTPWEKLLPELSFAPELIKSVPLPVMMNPSSDGLAWLNVAGAPPLPPVANRERVVTGVSGWQRAVLRSQITAALHLALQGVALAQSRKPIRIRNESATVKNRRHSEAKRSLALCAIGLYRTGSERPVAERGSGAMMTLGSRYEDLLVNLATGRGNKGPSKDSINKLIRALNHQGEVRLLAPKQYTKQMGRTKFMNSEDTMLALGLSRYGEPRLDMVQSKLLWRHPLNTVYNRLRNLSHASSAPSAVGEYVAHRARIVHFSALFAGEVLEGDHLAWQVWLSRLYGISLSDHPILGQLHADPPDGFSWGPPEQTKNRKQAKTAVKPVPASLVKMPDPVPLPVPMPLPVPVPGAPTSRPDPLEGHFDTTVLGVGEEESHKGRHWETDVLLDLASGSAGFSRDGSRDGAFSKMSLMDDSISKNASNSVQGPSREAGASSGGKSSGGGFISSLTQGLRNAMGLGAQDPISAKASTSANPSFSGTTTTTTTSTTNPSPNPNPNPNPAKGKQQTRYLRGRAVQFEQDELI